MNIKSSAPARIGGKLLGGTSGSIVFVDSNINFAQNNSNLFWDDVNGRVGIGTTGPGAKLQVNAASTKSGADETTWTTIFRDTQTSATGVGGGIVFMGLRSAAGAGQAFGAISGIKEISTDNNAQGALLFHTPPSSGIMAERMRIDSSGNVGIGTTGPTAVLHLKAGTASANTAPIKLTSGTLNTTPEAGAIEFDGTNLYFVNSAGTRKQLAVV